MNSFGQNTVELFLIWSLENCHFFFTYNNRKSEKKYYKSGWPRISAIAKQLSEQPGNDSVWAYKYRLFTPVDVCVRMVLHIFQPLFFLQQLGNV